LAATFLSTENRCPKDARLAGAPFSGFIKIDLVSHNVFLDWGHWIGNARFEVRYVATLYDGQGIQLEEWPLEGEGRWTYDGSANVVVGKMARDAVRDVVAKLMIRFSDERAPTHMAERPRLLELLGVETSSIAVRPAAPISPIAGSAGIILAILPDLRFHHFSLGQTEYGSSERDYGWWFDDCVSGEVAAASPSVSTLASIEFRDALFPWLERSVVVASEEAVQGLLARPEVRKRLSTLGVRFVARLRANTHIGPVDDKVIRGSSIWGFGVMTQPRRTEISAVVWDLVSKADAAHVKVEVEGNLSMAFIVVPIPLSLGDTAQEACEQLGRRLVEHLMSR
jgi:hypothetical protein